MTVWRIVTLTMANDSQLGTDVNCGLPTSSCRCGARAITEALFFTMDRRERAPHVATDGRWNRCAASMAVLAESGGKPHYLTPGKWQHPHVRTQTGITAQAHQLTNAERVVSGWPADSIFYHAIKGAFDAVLVMYHDQGHIPVKVHGFEKSVSVALGLPLLRTAVDHGTAFDIAGKGSANAESMVEAIKMAIWLRQGKGLTGKRVGR